MYSHVRAPQRLARLALFVALVAGPTAASVAYAAPAHATGYCVGVYNGPTTATVCTP